MTVELDPSAPDAITWLTDRIRGHFGDRRLGVYLYGSAVYGDFVVGTSDLDFVCALQDDVTEAELNDLRLLHEELRVRWPEFTDRIEVQYANIHRVRRFRERRFPIANISPGEPIHLIDTGAEWLMNWYFAVHYSQTIVGPPPASLFPDISDAEFVQAARAHAIWWLDQPHRFGTQKGQSYAALTLSRALYTHRTGRHVSKERAARYAASWLPEYAPMLDDALRWRIDPDRPAPETEERASTFVEMIARIIAEETIGGR
jgi:hypothetical protein